MCPRRSVLVAKNTQDCYFAGKCDSKFACAHEIAVGESLCNVIVANGPKRKGHIQQTGRTRDLLQRHSGVDRNCGVDVRNGEPEQPRGEAWDRAEERLLLYLRVLHVPVIQRMKLAREALQRAAAKSTANRGKHPVASAMQNLRVMIAERNLSPSWDGARQGQGGGEQVRGEKPSPQGVPGRADEGAPPQNLSEPADVLPAAPPVQRSAMVPGSIDRSPWRSFFSRRLRRSRRKR